MKKTDKRKFPRLSYDVELKYEILNLSSPTTQKSRVKNISVGGLCIMIFEKVKVGTLLKIEFSLLPKDKTIVAKGRVVWVEELEIISTDFFSASYDCGIEFVDISPQDQESINHHVMINIRDGKKHRRQPHE
jgi:c-di-GMP-binding flagellar brake protein YcgR